jgi:CRISPR-associated protein Cmr5
MSTLQQRRASSAFEAVSNVPDQARSKYATAAHRAPALIRNAGLCQALHFAQARNDAAGWARWLDHMAVFLAEQQRIQGASADALLKASRDAELSVYLGLSADALHYAEWLQRMVRAVLKVDAAEADDSE